jgi:hypothetical protein
MQATPNKKKDCTDNSAKDEEYDPNCAADEGGLPEQ